MQAVALFCFLSLVAPLCVAADTGTTDSCQRSGLRSVQETLICADWTLRSLDDRLGEVYEAAVFFSKQREKLRADQRRWLKKTRASCRDAHCLEKVYRRRILYLDDLIRATLVPSGRAVDSSNVEAVCKDVLRLADRKKLASHHIPQVPLHIIEEERPDLLRVQGKPLSEVIAAVNEKANARLWESVTLLRLSSGRTPVVFGSNSEGGSCSSTRLENISLAAAEYMNDDFELRTWADIHTEDDDLGQSGWGAGDYLVFVNGRHLVITAANGDPNRVNLVSWIKPEGEVVPLCSALIEKRTKVIARAVEPKVCQRLLSGTAEALNWEPAEIRMPRDDWYKRFGGYADSVKVTALNAEGGEPRQDVARFTYDSGAGCGSHNEWLRTINPERSDTVRGALDESLVKIGIKSEVNLWRVDKRLFLEVSDGFREGAAYRLTRGGVTKTCRFSWNTKSGVDRYWLILPIKTRAERLF